MKKLLKTTPWLLLLIFSAGTLFAQAETNRIERDIRIAEGILSELFDGEDTGFTIRGGNLRGVSGEYIPDYGVHFKIGSNINRFTVRSVVIRGHAQIETEEEPDETESAEAGREFVKERFNDYFKNYASLIREIPGHEVIRLSYGAESPGQTFVMYPDNRNRESQKTPSLTAWASVADIQSYSNGDISEEEFENRIEVRDLAEQETQRDQEVFSSILETALNQAETDNIRIRRNPRADYLPGMGLSYQVQLSLRPRPFFGDLEIEGLELKIDSLAVGLTNLSEHLGKHLLPMAVKLDSIFNPHRRHVSNDSLVRVYRDSLRNSAQSLRRNFQDEELSEEEIREEINKLHTELRQTVIEYGPTLRSLQDDEMLMITLNWSGRHPVLPRRSELRILKGDLLNGVDPVITRVERN